MFYSCVLLITDLQCVILLKSLSVPPACPTSPTTNERNEALYSHITVMQLDGNTLIEVKKMSNGLSS